MSCPLLPPVRADLARRNGQRHRGSAHRASDTATTGRPSVTAWLHPKTAAHTISPVGAPCAAWSAQLCSWVVGAFCHHDRTRDCRCGSVSRACGVASSPRRVEAAPVRATTSWVGLKRKQGVLAAWRQPLGDSRAAAGPARAARRCPRRQRATPRILVSVSTLAERPRPLKTRRVCPPHPTLNLPPGQNRAQHHQPAHRPLTLGGACVLLVLHHALLRGAAGESGQVVTRTRPRTG